MVTQNTFGHVAITTHRGSSPVSAQRSRVAGQPPPPPPHRAAPRDTRMRSKPAAKPAAAGGDPLKKILTTDKLIKKYVALALLHFAGWPPEQVVRTVKGGGRHGLRSWGEQLVKNGELQTTFVINRPSKITENDLDILKDKLQNGGAGQRKWMSLRKAVPAAIAAGATFASRETYRQQLIDSNWADQPIKRRLPDPDEKMRKAFCTVESRGIASNTMFTDSKYFRGQYTPDSRLGHAWGPIGEPLSVVVSQKSQMQAHVYAGVTRYGATPLIFVTGTTKPKGKKKKKLAKPAAATERPSDQTRAHTDPPAPPPPTHPAEAAQKRGVDAQEYRSKVLLGERGLLCQGRALFAAHDVEQWRFQQDGAPVHTTKAHTALGKATRTAIEKKAKLVEPWPAHSPDLSPIEKAWGFAEAKLWETESWTNQKEFEAALLRVWEKWITPEYCKKLFGGIRATYETCAKLDGVLVAGWGKTCRAKLHEADGGAEGDDGAEG